jgi:hypothetical protein
LRDRSALGLGLALVGAASHALAQGESPPLQIALEYHANSALNDCPSAAELSATVGKQLGFNPFVATAIGGERRVKVMIERTPHGTEAHLQWFNERGESEAERSLTSESQGCALAKPKGAPSALVFEPPAEPERSATRLLASTVTSYSSAQRSAWRSGCMT